MERYRNVSLVSARTHLGYGQDNKECAPSREVSACRERERLSPQFCTKQDSPTPSPAREKKKKANGRLPQHKWCEILLDGLKSVFKDAKAPLLKRLKGCGANQDDFGMNTFRLD